MIVVGHRGARGLAPENTLAALSKGLEFGVDGVEFDIRVTKDKIPVLHHNSHIKDGSGNKLLIKDFSFDELQKHKADLLDLKSALKFIYGKTKLYIEIKPGELLAPILAELQRYLKSDSSEIFICSFDYDLLKVVRQKSPKSKLIVIEKWSSVRAYWRAKKLNTDIISLDHSVLWPGLVLGMARRGVKLYAYTVNDAREAKRLAKYGLTGIFTDRPDIM